MKCCTLNRVPLRCFYKKIVPSKFLKIWLVRQVNPSETKINSRLMFIIVRRDPGLEFWRS